MAIPVVSVSNFVHEMQFPLDRWHRSRDRRGGAHGRRRRREDLHPGARARDPYPYRRVRRRRPHPGDGGHGAGASTACATRGRLVTPVISAGDTAWVLISTGLVMLM